MKPARGAFLWRYLYLYLLTSRHQTSAGAYRLPNGYASTDLRWTPERYVEARELLMQAELIRFDSQTSVIMIPRWFKHNPPMNPDHLKSIEGEIDRLPSQSLKEAARNDLELIQESIEAERLAKTARTPNGLGGAATERLNTRFLKGVT